MSSPPGPIRRIRLQLPTATPPVVIAHWRRMVESERVIQPVDASVSRRPTQSSAQKVSE